MMAILETRKLNKRFGGLQVTSDVDFALEAGELHCLIGPNGAGKSTLFKMIMGQEAPDAGTLRVGETVVPMCAPARAQLEPCMGAGACGLGDL